MADKVNHDRSDFELLDGEVRVWIEREAIHMIAIDRGAPVELGDDARELAAVLLELAERADVFAGIRADRNTGRSNNGWMKAGDKNYNRPVFELLDGDVGVWIEQEDIHMRAIDRRSGDPVELTPTLARRLAAVLLELVDQTDE